eukprot:Phypoly_transcript_05077.p1 GENE.Phypoly_transcript_05077~~Phypoly_transcript_05077.p1  ORF type:complete len:609 (-),score=73.08 Phypoly_transcript_05077:208-1770(-)
MEPKNPTGHLLMGEIYLCMRNPKEAESIFATALSHAEDASHLKDIKKRIEEAKSKTKFGAPRPVVKCMPKDLVAEYYNEGFMIQSWAMNTWWNVPTSLANPHPSIKQQVENMTINKHLGSLKNCSRNETTTQIYRSHGFSKDINIMQGPSMFSHSVFLDFGKGDPNRFVAVCESFEAIPDVILWAPDIPYHMFLAQGSEMEGRESHRELTMVLDESVNQNYKDEKKARKVLLQRAWKEAVRVPEMHHLVLVVYPALRLRYFKKKSKKHMQEEIKFLTEFLGTCTKIKTTNFKGFRKAADNLAEILEAKGMIKEAKRYYNLAIETRYSFKYSVEEEEYNKQTAVLHCNLGLLLKNNREYDEAWVHYKQSAHIDFAPGIFENIMKLFVEQEWKSHKWRVDAALAFLKVHWNSIQGNAINIVQDPTNFWPSVINRASGGKLKILPNVPKDKTMSDARTGVKEIAKQVGRSFQYPCAFCHQMFSKVKTCSGCGVRAYCGRECQLKDWPNHKAECKKVQAENNAK